MNPNDIDRVIDGLIIEGKKRNRLPQNLELSQGTRRRLVDAVLNCIDVNETDEFIGGYVLGFLLGYGHLFNDVACMFRSGMITRADKNGINTNTL